MRFFSTIFLFIWLSAPVFAKDIETNEIVMTGAPSWVTTSLVDRVAQKIQSFMEWDIRKIHVYWHPDQAEFQKLHGFDASVLAFSRRTDMTVHLGPRITAENFGPVFGHELTHIIVYQKYKDAIPKWLDEGLANYAADRRNVDYRWLASQPFEDIHGLTHPFEDHQALYHYQASTAMMEMIASHCSVTDLLQLSVGKKLETYLSTFCGIDDINASFQEWVKKKAR